jgi:hypothetical protein
MNDQPDIDRILRTWLSDGPIEMPDRVVAVVADRIGRQPQRRRWRLPRRLTVNPSVKPLITVAAVAVIAIAGVAIVSRPSAPSIGGIASPSPTRSSSPSAAPTPTATAVAPASPPWDELGTGRCGPFSCGGPQTAGTYASKALNPPVTYTLTTKWVNLRDWPEFFQLYPDTLANRAVAAAGGYPPYILILPAGATCLGDSPTDQVAVTASQFVEFIGTREGLTTSEPIPVTLSGMSGRQIDVAIEPGWTGCMPGAPMGEELTPTDRVRFIVLDRQGGDSLMIRLRAPTDFDAFVEEAMPVVESFRFDGTN